MLVSHSYSMLVQHFRRSIISRLNVKAAVILKNKQPAVHLKKKVFRSKYCPKLSRKVLNINVNCINYL